MSHKVTYKSEFTDADLVKSALNISKYTYSQSGTRFTITSGPLRNATIDTTTGLVEGDTDFRNHTEEKFGEFRQVYSEAQFLRNANLNGVQVESREVATVNGVKGVVRLICNAAG